MQSFNINFAVPSKWSELSDKQLRYVYQLIADGNDAKISSCVSLRSFVIKVIFKKRLRVRLLYIYIFYI